MRPRLVLGSQWALCTLVFLLVSGAGLALFAVSCRGSPTDSTFPQGKLLYMSDDGGYWHLYWIDLTGTPAPVALTSGEGQEANG